MKEINSSSQGARSPSLTLGRSEAPSQADGRSRAELLAELRNLKTLTARVREEIRLVDQERARRTLKGLPPHQRTVLQAFAVGLAEWGEEEWCYGFRTIGAETGLTRAQVSRACKALRGLGFLRFEKGLFTNDGEVAGAGYGLTKDGLAWWASVEAAPSSQTPTSQGDAEGGVLGNSGNPS